MRISNSASLRLALLAVYACRLFIASQMAAFGEWLSTKNVLEHNDCFYVNSIFGKGMTIGSAPVFILRVALYFLETLFLSVTKLFIDCFFG